VNLRPMKSYVRQEKSNRFILLKATNGKWYVCPGSWMLSHDNIGWIYIDELGLKDPVEENPVYIDDEVREYGSSQHYVVRGVMPNGNVIVFDQNNSMLLTLHPNILMFNEKMVTSFKKEIVGP